MRSSDEIKNNATIHKINSYDKEISSEKHDEIVVWLFNQIEKDSTMFKKIFPKQMLNDGWYFVKLEKYIEHPIGHNKIIGFSDLYFRMEFKKPPTEKEIEWNFENNYKKISKDVIRSWHKQMFYNFYIEVKTSLNIGETIRQIKYYNSHIHTIHNEKTCWFVCSPEIKNKDVLLSQGIGFIKYKP